MLYVICYSVIGLNVIFGICYYVTLLSVSTVYCLLRRCCWPSLKNLAALKQFGVCDNTLFDLTLTLWGASADGQIRRVVLPQLYSLCAIGQEVQYPVTQCSTEVQVLKFGGEFAWKD